MPQEKQETLAFQPGSPETNIWVQKSVQGLLDAGQLTIVPPKSENDFDPNSTIDLSFWF